MCYIQAWNKSSTQGRLDNIYNNLEIYIKKLKKITKFIINTL